MDSWLTMDFTSKTGYPLASSVFDYDKLGCKPFGYGTDVIAPSEKKIKHWRLLDPFRHPIKSIFYVLEIVYLTHESTQSRFTEG